MVGAEKKKFVLHKKLVCREAPYFDRMFNGNLKEAKTQKCCLQEEEPSTFKLFVSYIYAGRFPADVKAVTGILPVYEPIIKFYILADKLLMSRSENSCFGGIYHSPLLILPSYERSHDGIGTQSDCR